MHVRPILAVICFFDLPRDWEVIGLSSGRSFEVIGFLALTVRGVSSTIVRCLSFSCLGLQRYVEVIGFVFPFCNKKKLLSRRSSGFLGYSSSYNLSEKIRRRSTLQHGSMICSGPMEQFQKQSMAIR